MNVKDFMESLVEFIQRRKEVLLTIVIAVALILFLSFNFFSYKQKKTIEDFVIAHKSFNDWVSNNKTKSLGILRKKMEKHKELDVKFSCSLINADIFNSKKRFDGNYKSLFGDKLTKMLPHHMLFSESSLNILNENYSAAATDAAKLKEELESGSCNHGSFLYLFNMLRLANLMHELKDCEGELNALTTLEDKLLVNNTNKDSSEESENSRKIFQNIFQEKETSLLQYIKHRKENIEKLKISVVTQDAI